MTHDLETTATEFVVWNFTTQAYDTLRFVRRPVADVHPEGWSKFLRMWVEDAEISGRITMLTLDSLARDIGLNLPHAMGLIFDDRAPRHAAIDSLQGTDILLLDIRDGYDPGCDSTWVAGFMDRCDTKSWVPDGRLWTGGGNQANELYLDTWPQAHTDPAWSGLMSGWLYGRWASSVWGPQKPPLLECGVARSGRGRFSPAYEHYRHPQMCGWRCGVTRGWRGLIWPGLWVWLWIGWWMSCRIGAPCS